MPTPPRSAPSVSTQVWDVPLRLFHWVLVAAVAGSAVTGVIGGNWMVWHGRLGIAICGLLAFRIAWGVLGSTHSRFTSFVRGPAAILDYVRGRGPEAAGHNPLGALSVLAMLTVLTFQAVSGLFGNDDIAFQGPLYRLASKSDSDWLTGLHRQNAWLLLVLVITHLGAIAYYWRAKGENLVLPMIHGRKELPAARAVPVRGGGWVAVLIAACIGALALAGASGAFVPKPPPAPAFKTPDF